MFNISSHVRLLLCVGLFVLCGGVAQAGELQLARQGRQSRYAVVIPTNASPCVRWAAREFASVIRQQTGVTLPITTQARAANVVFDVRTDLFPSPDEGFQLRAIPPHLFIISGGGRGALYGVYEMLERFGGCAWYAPHFTNIPQRVSWCVPDNLNDTQRPAFLLRNQNWGRHDPFFVMANKLNSSAWGSDFGEPVAQFDRLLGKCHTFNTLLPVDKWFDTHPEYFSEIGGKRIRFHTQLCLSNPEVLRHCTAFLLARLAESYPKGIRYYGISANDWGNFCQCAACAACTRREQSPAAPLIAFVNKLADAVAPRYPGAVIQTLAYECSRRPPKTLRPRPNVQICFCTIACDFSRALGESRARINREAYVDLKRWAQGGAPLSVWDYASDYAAYLHPWIDYTARQRNILYYKSCGADQLYELGNGGGVNDIWNNLRYWLIAKWMWNPAAPLEDLLARALTDHFGPVADSMCAYVHIMEGAVRDTKRHPMGCFERIESSGISDASLQQADLLFDRAERILSALPRTPANQQYRQRLACARLPVDFAHAMRGAGRTFVSTDPKRRDALRWERDRAAARRVLERATTFADDAAANTNYTARLRALAQSDVGPCLRRRVRLQETALIGDYPSTLFCYVHDKDATDGNAILLPGARVQALAWLNFQTLTYDRDKLYTIRFRVKVVPPQQSDPACTAHLTFRSGVYDHIGERSVTFFSPNPQYVTPNVYRWYQLQPLTFRPGWAFWIDLPYTAESGQAPDVYIDCVEIVSNR